MSSKFSDYINKSEDNEMSSKQLDILINEIRGLREDIKMITEAQGGSNAAPAQSYHSQPVNPVVENSQPQQAPESQQTLFGMPIPDRSGNAIQPQQQMDMMAHAGKILS